jgi:hypothetical protein
VAILKSTLRIGSAQRAYAELSKFSFYLNVIQGPNNTVLINEIYCFDSNEMRRWFYYSDRFGNAHLTTHIKQNGTQLELLLPWHGGSAHLTAKSINSRLIYKRRRICKPIGHIAAREGLMELKASLGHLFSGRKSSA